jgi:hypothetical protein
MPKIKGKSQKEKILDYLQKRSRKTTKGIKYYNTITPIDALTMFGCFRLGAIIHALKKEGLVFETNMIKNDYGNHFAQYRLL